MRVEVAELSSDSWEIRKNIWHKEIDEQNERLQLDKGGNLNNNSANQHKGRTFFIKKNKKIVFPFLFFKDFSIVFKANLILRFVFIISIIVKNILQKENKFKTSNCFFYCF